MSAEDDRGPEAEEPERITMVPCDACCGKGLLSPEERERLRTKYPGLASRADCAEEDEPGVKSI